MEEDGAHIVQVAVEGKETSPRLVRPDFDFVVITARNEQWLCFVEIDASYWTIMLLETINQCSHPIVP